MTNDIVALIDYYEKEKGIDRDKVVAALEYAFISAYRKMVPGADAIETLRADVNTKKGETRIFAVLTVVEDGEQNDKFNQVVLSTASKKNPSVQPGETMEFNVTPKDFGRIAVQTAKQTMMQRLRQAEKEMIYEEFKDRAGDIVSGTVRRFDRSDVLVDLGKFEGVMPSRERVQTEEYNIGDRIRAYVVAVENEGRGPEIILSRSHPNFVRRLFEAEVNEISDRTVEIRGIAREAGYRTKVAVWSTDDKVDPVGACVGLRGARVKNIVRELNNEKVDIIRWSDNPEEFVREALKPAVLRTITVDTENRVLHVTVEEEDLSKAIGRRGQNARLSSRLMGWDVQVRKDESKLEQFEKKIAGAAHSVGELLGLEDELADKLFRAGGTSTDMVADMDAEYIMEELGVSEERALDILARARGNAASA
ncbi:transcription termination factor NusA [Luteolibacter sp. GHJ8]|jgi:N utilization substance protein A|uniref:Transcription termination/antitermination protein NusA n=1 Tax=Luteolibacter rhizosphaerae TaxID=2989719 RepID=A0ABT3G9W1_9BACT|nr:transcription termination factor NusA [Luteolibacter rhizosphaerae]MCW1916259.1 transcription termination factor NusA [Luteolibacter rhizosphaerae]